MKLERTASSQNSEMFPISITVMFYFNFILSISIKCKAYFRYFLTNPSDDIKKWAGSISSDWGKKVRKCRDYSKVSKEK